MNRPGIFALHALCAANPDSKFVEEAHRGSIRRRFRTKRRGLRRGLGAIGISRSCRRNRFRLGGPVHFQLPCFHFAPKGGTVFDDQPVGLHFAGNLAGAADLQFIPGDNFPSTLPRTIISRALRSAFTFPFGPTVKQQFEVRFSFPSTKPSTKRSSVPVTSPLTRIP